MTRTPPLREIPDLPAEIIQAGPNGELVLFVGAGLSMLTGLLSWKGLAKAALEDLREHELLDFSELEQLESLPPRTQLSIAKLIAQENTYSLDIAKYFGAASEGAGVYKALNNIGCACVTTNYDELLAPRFLATKDGSTTPKPTTRIYERSEVLARRLDDPGAVIHLHGSISNSEQMVVTTKDYLERYDYENIQHFLGELFGRKTVLFLGYGLEENELLEHILRRGAARPTGDRRRFALQGFFRSQQPLYEKLYEYYRASFGVHLVGFVRDHKNYRQQEAIINTWAPLIKIAEPALADDLNRMNEVLGNGSA